MDDEEEEPSLAFMVNITGLTLSAMLGNDTGLANGSMLGSGGGRGQLHRFFRQFIQCLDVYILPVVAIVGLVGNALSFAVFIGTYMKRLSSSIYLGALAVANTGFLLCVLVSWTMNARLGIYEQEGWCQTFTYITHVSSFLSVWYVVSFTVEGFIVVHFPLRRQDLCTVRRAKIVVLTLATAALLIYSFVTWMSGVSYIVSIPICGPLPEYATAYSIMNNVDTIITLIFPFITILLMNMKIAFKVASFYRGSQTGESLGVRRVYVNAQKTPDRRLRARARKIRRRPWHTKRSKVKQRTLYTRTQVRITKLLLIVSTIFLALNLPRHTLRLYAFIMSLIDEDFHLSSAFILWQKFFQFLYYMNFSLNIFLYSMLGKNFRRAFLRLARRIKYGAQHWARRHCKAVYVRVNPGTELRLEPLPRKDDSSYV